MKHPLAWYAYERSTGTPCMLNDVDIAALGVLSRGTFTPLCRGLHVWCWQAEVGSVEERAAWHLVRARIVAVQHDGYRLTSEGIQRIEGMLARNENGAGS